MYLALLTLAPNHITDELIKVETNFIRKNPPRKIKHRTLILDDKQGDLKRVDVMFSDSFYA